MSQEREIGVVPCKVQRGWFSSEVAVTIESPDGKKYSGFFDESYVSVGQEIKSDSEIEGRFSVEIIEEKDNSVLVEFSRNPAQHLMPNTPSRAWLPKSFLLPQEEANTTE